jgi:membrane-bound serine protease (ClpP class)
MIGFAECVNNIDKQGLRCYIILDMRKITFLLLILFCLYSLGISGAKESVYPAKSKLNDSLLPKTSNGVYVIPVKGTIDLGLSGFIRRSLEEAKENRASAIILEIDTFGGRVDAAVEISDALEKIKPTPTIAFVDDHAWSAGALISLSCEKIIMSPGSSIGSAEPRAMGFAGKDELTDEKTVSAIRAKFKALAEENNHPVNLALAMVDKDFEIKQIKVKEEIKIVTADELEEIKQQYKSRDIQILKTISAKEKLLNLTAGEAKDFGLTKTILNNRQAVLDYLGLSNKKVIKTSLTWSEMLVRFLTHPLISPLLLSLGFLGILFELKIPGWGISGTLGLLFLALFFWGHYLVGLAGWTELIILFLGILLLLIEIFVIPGFGIAGVSGIVLILTGIFLSLVKHPLSTPKSQLIQAFYTMSFAIIITFVGVILSWKFLPRTGLWKRIILGFAETKKQGFQSAASLESYLGKNGRSLTALRPSGRAIIEDKTLDVITEGEFIDKDKSIKVIKVKGNKIIVKLA